MQQIDPNDFRLKPMQIILYFIVTGGLIFIFLSFNFKLWQASLMSLGIMILLILMEYLIIGYLEKRRDDKEWDEQHGIDNKH